MKYIAGQSMEGTPFFVVVGENGIVVAMRVTSLPMAKRIARLLEEDDQRVEAAAISGAVEKRLKELR